jgi:hypothetical protein
MLKVQKMHLWKTILWEIKKRHKASFFNQEIKRNGNLKQTVQK